jgi:hypothetical protein
MKDPFKTNKNYGSMDVIKMLYDIEEYSQIEQKYDPNSVVVGHTNQDFEVSQEVYNLVISEGLRGLTF